MTPGVVASVAALVPQGLLEGAGRVALLGGYGAFILIVLYAGYIKIEALYGDGDHESPPTVNCSSCGARTRRDRDACQYCGEPRDG